MWRTTALAWTDHSRTRRTEPTGFAQRSVTCKRSATATRCRIYRTGRSSALRPRCPMTGASRSCSTSVITQLIRPRLCPIARGRFAPIPSPTIVAASKFVRIVAASGCSCSTASSKSRAWDWTVSFGPPIFAIQTKTARPIRRTRSTRF